MNKSQLVDQLAERSGLSKTKAQEVVEALFDPSSGLISEALQAGGKVGLQDFGSFGVKEWAARTGRNPRTGKKIEIPARLSCTFKPRQGLRSGMKDMVGA